MVESVNIEGERWRRWRIYPSVLSVLSRLGNLKNYFIPPKLEVNQNFPFL